MLKNRVDDGLKSLQFLRGWRSPSAVISEFNKLMRHNEKSRSCVQCEKLVIKCVHLEPTIYDQFKCMKQQRIRKPFIMIVILQFFMQFSGMSCMRPYIVPILNAYGMPLDSNSTTVLLGLLGIFAIFCLLLSIRSLGKRNIFLVSIAMSLLTYFALSKHSTIFRRVIFF